MKNKLSVQLWKIVTVALLTFLIVAGVLHVTDMDGADVYAGDVTTENVTPENVDYKLIKYSDISEYRVNNATNQLYTDVISIPDEYSDGKEWIFAGWYADAKLNEDGELFNNIKRSVTSGEGYAKYVSADILSVKCQTSKSTTPDSPNTVLRCVSSVDSLKYNRIGFDIITPDEEGNLDYENIPEKSDNKVGVRIYADAEEDAYTYSPKVVDTESEYFFSTTITVEKDKFSYRHLIKPYWITKDGTKVYGVSRYVTVNEGIAKDTIHVAVKMAEPTVTNFGVSSPATGSEYIGYDGTYAYFAIKVEDRTTLDSVTKFGIFDTDNNELGTCYYRNLLTSNNESNADTSWYEAYKDGEGNLTEDEFVIATSADLYGFASVAASNDKTFYLASDIVVNEETIDPTSDGWATLSAELRAWNPVGTTTETAFKGIFDGKGHTISGLYTVGEKNKAIGLFGHVNGAQIKNLRLTNSYFKGVNQVACIAGKGQGNFENIYSDVRIDAEIQTGGIVGFANGQSDLTLCWYDGTLTTKYHSGGIIGAIGSSSAVAQVTMTNCLNTGITTSTASENDSTTYIDVTASHINYERPYVSGFAGYVHDSSQLTINTSLSVGTITLPSVATQAWKGWAVSYTQQGGGDVTITDSYAYKNGLSRAIGTGSSLYLNTGLDTSQITGDTLKNATTGLNWTDIYVLQSNGKPGIKSLIVK